MKKNVFLCLLIILLFLPGGSVLGAPLPGVWNGTTTTLGPAFDGYLAVLELPSGGFGVGDELRAKDNFSLGMGHDFTYWAINSLVREINILGTYIFEDTNADGIDDIGYRTDYIERTGGNLFIDGENLWGQESGSMYTASIKSAGFTTVHIAPNGTGGWAFDYAEGNSNISGNFNDDPFSIEMTSTFYIDFQGYNDFFDRNILLGSFDNVEMTIAPVPEPATILLLGTGLVGLAGASRKKFFKK